MTLYESYITGDDADGDVYGDDWKAQTITPDETHTIRKVRLKLAREGTEPQTLTVSIKAVDVGGDPTAGDLASGTLDTDNLSDTAAWYDISFGAGVELTAATQYAIVTRQDGAYADRVYWRNDSTSASYDGGVFVMSDDAGTTWVQLATDDFMFEDWGS